MQRNIVTLKLRRRSIDSSLGVLERQLGKLSQAERPSGQHAGETPDELAIRSSSDLLQAQLDLERHGGRKPAGVCARVLQRLLALTAAIWHNETSNQPGPARSLIAYDH